MNTIKLSYYKFKLSYSKLQTFIMFVAVFILSTIMLSPNEYNITINQLENKFWLVGDTFLW